MPPNKLPKSRRAASACLRRTTTSAPATQDIKLREQYVAHITKMLTFAGSRPEQALRDAQNILAMETALAKASLGAVDMRDPEKTYHLQPVATFEASLPGFNFTAFEDAIHSPHVTEINNSTPQFWPEMIKQIQTADIATIKAYLRYQVLSLSPRNMPKEYDAENFDFFGRILNGQPEQEARWKRCSNAVDGGLGEALGKVYVDQYFAGDSKAQVLQMVHDIEAAMGRDIDQIDWMSPATKVKAKEKLAAVADKIGYPDKWRDYSKLTIKPDDPYGNTLRATDFENDRELNKIGKPVDHGEWRNDSAHRQRLLRRQHERHQLPRRNPAAAVLRPLPGRSPSTTATSAPSSATNSPTASTTKAASSTPRATSTTGGPPTT